MTDSYDPKIDSDLKFIRMAGAEADEISAVIKELARIGPDSRAKVISTVQAYYGLQDASDPGWLEMLQASINQSQKDMAKLVYPTPHIPIHEREGCHDEEEEDLARLVDDFSGIMLKKLIEKKRSEGYEGWDEPSISNIDGLWDQLTDHVEKGSDHDNLVDIANFCAFLWNLRKKS
jgi:hypothetical protein